MQPALGEVSARPRDVDRRVGHSVVVAFAASVAVAGVAWGALYLALDVRSAAAYPLGFSLLTAVNALAYRTTGRLVPFAAVQVGAILAVPALLANHLGGFQASGAIPLWSALAPIGAMLFLGPAAALAALAGFAVVAIVTTAPTAPTGNPVLTDGAIASFTSLNLFGVATIAVASVRRFVTTYAALQEQQRRVRELERAYVSQEALLRQQERLATLGKLSAGVAHELNNPAAAARRAAGALAEVLEGLGPPAAADAATPPPDARCVSAIRGAVGPGPPDDPLDRSDRIDALGVWLEGMGLADAWELADALADAGLDVPSLSQAATGFAAADVRAALRWRAGTERARRLAVEVRASTTRIGEIVTALKGYTHMDGVARHDVDVVRGLEDTLVMLRGELRGIDVVRAYDEEVPTVVGNAGELNQVWTNLIANAAQAMAGRGTLTLRVTASGDTVRVAVEDDGPGLAAELLPHVFEPFVTTKDPGEGTGLGLHLVHRTITDRHGGSVEASSRPGHTAFTVTLPIAAAEPGHG
jgi:signal transduction histidine kinase